MKKKFSIVIPIYKNEKNLPITIPYIIEKLPLFSDYDVEIVMVNDGSPDNSYEVMKEFQKEYPNLIKIGTLSRNFGQLECTHAGIALATGDVVGVISADMQEPFELFADMLKEWERGYKIVMGVRAARDEKGLYVIFAKLFHKFTQKYLCKMYPQGGCDFYIMDKKVAQEYLSIDGRYTGGMLNRYWLGYKQKEIPYVRAERKAGKSGFSIGKKIDVAMGVVFMNSPFPLKIILGLALFLILIGGITGVVSAILGRMSLLLCAFVSLMTGLILLSNYILGEYLWRAYEVVKARPRYIMDEVIDQTTKNKENQ